MARRLGVSGTGTGVQVAGQLGSSHYYSEEEKMAFVNYINMQLSGTDAPHLPMSPAGDDLFVKVEDGVILCKLLVKAVPGSLDEKRICRKDPMSKYQKGENLQLFLDHCGKAGIKLVNIGVDDVMERKAHLILGVVWQIIKVGLFHKLLQSHPEMVVLLHPDEDVEAWDKLSQEELVLRWLNHHLKRVDAGIEVTNFGNDLKDGRALCALMGSVEDAQGAPLLADWRSLDGASDAERAAAAIRAAGRVNLDNFITLESVAQGNSRLLFAFLANVFRNMPALPPLTKAYLSLNSNATSLQKQVQTLRSEVSQVSTELQKTKGALESRDTAETVAESAKNARLTSEIQSLLGEAFDDGVPRDSANITSQLQALIAELSTLRKVVRDQKGEIESKQRQLESEREKNEELARQMHAMGDSLGDLRSQLSNTEMEREDALSRIDGVRNAFMSLHDSLTVEKAGWLSKQGKRIKMWNKRWFVLKGKMLFYFRAPADVALQKPLGFYNLADYSAPGVETTKPELIKLTAIKDKGTIEMLAASAHEAKSWVTVISNTQDKLKEAEEKKQEVEKLTDIKSVRATISSPSPSAPTTPSAAAGGGYASGLPSTPKGKLAEIDDLDDVSDDEKEGSSVAAEASEKFAAESRVVVEPREKKSEKIEEKPEEKTEEKTPEIEEPLPEKKPQTPPPCPDDDDEDEDEDEDEPPPPPPAPKAQEESIDC